MTDVLLAAQTTGANGLRISRVIDAPTRTATRPLGTDLHTSTFTQHVAYEVARDGFLDEHVRTIRRAYRERRDAMLAAMTECFPAGVTWTRPQGGLFLWVRLPDTIDAADLLRESLKEKVAFLVGSPFFVDGSGRNTARFNFSNADPERIRAGIRRIAVVLDRMMASALVR